MRLSIFVMVILLSGCGITIPNYQLKAAAMSCLKSGGIFAISTQSHGRLIAVCMDGRQITIESDGRLANN